MQLNLGIPPFNQNFLFLDKGVLGNNYLKITLHGRFARKTGAFFQFIVSKKFSIFLLVKFGFSGL